MMFSFIFVFTGCFKHSVFFMSHFSFRVSMVSMVPLKQNNFFLTYFLSHGTFKKKNQ